MARKKEYTVSGDVSNGGKRIQEDPLSKGSQPSMDSNRSSHSISKRKETAYPDTNECNVYDVADLRAQLGSFGLTVRDIPGDGNCLFRALGDQLDGHTGNHLKHRLDTVRYMVNHRGHFEPFIDVPFDRYVNDLSRPGTYAGQDALVAFARLHEVNIIIHQLKRPLWKIQGSEDCNAPELHLSYHNGEHYSSVRRFGDIANTPAGIRIMASTTVPCCAPHSVYTPTKPITSSAGSGSIQAATPHLHKHNGDSSGTVEQTYFHNEDEFTALVREVMNRSGCRDGSLATEALIENSGDLDQAVDYLLSVALFVGSGVNGNFSKVINESDMEIGGSRMSSDRTIENLSRHRTLSTHLARARAELIASQQQVKRERKQGSNVQEEIMNTEGDLRFLTL